MRPVEQGVTVIVERRVKPECVLAFEAWMSGIIAAASRFEGHLGAEVIRPFDPAQEDYVLVFRFQSLPLLKRWEESSVRAEWLDRSGAYCVGSARVQRITGLEYWFTVPGKPAARPPPRHKMLLVTVVALFPLVTFLAPAVARVLGGLPAPVASLITVTVMVTLMTYLVMPVLTRLLARWLFPG